MFSLKNMRPELKPKQVFFDYIETFYDRGRRHSRLDYEAPLLFEQNYVKAA